jgi:hypothetical protein
LYLAEFPQPALNPNTSAKAWPDFADDELDYFAGGFASKFFLFAGVHFVIKSVSQCAITTPIKTHSEGNGFRTTLADEALFQLF